MKSEPFWPLSLMTDRQNKAFDKSFDAAFDQAGGSYARMATAMTQYTNEYISHQALRNWRNKRSIPVHWALVLEDMYDYNGVKFFDLVPWLHARFRNVA